jgi:hypothetical protein
VWALPTQKRHTPFGRVPFLYPLRKDIMKILHQLTRAQTDHLVALCSQHLTLTGDVSNYARGRQRSWLRHEAPLSDARAWRHGQPKYTSYGTKLLEICSQISFVPEVGLASLGGEITRLTVTPLMPTGEPSASTWA